MTIEALYQLYKQYPSVKTDTRAIVEGDIFFALKGPNFNGNLFAEKALEMGAAYAVIDEPQSENERLILVEDVLATLQALAGYHRAQFSIPFIGITGSNGKTTTKELVHAVLATQFKTYYTKGNLNNHIGVPLTLLSIQSDAEMAIIEMGANHQKEIASYCQYAQPTAGLITNCGKAHLEGFGGVEGVRKGKGELFDWIRAHDGFVFAFDDYDYFHEMTHDIQPIHWYGTKNGEVIGTIADSSEFLTVELSAGLGAPTTIHTHLVGDYNLPNVLAAISVGKVFGVTAENIQKGIENYLPSNSRSQLIDNGKNKIILDAYNANPSSMKAAVENFENFDGAQSDKVLLLGSMKELGNESQDEHQKLVDLIHENEWKLVVLVGPEYATTEKYGYAYFEKVEAALEWLPTQSISQNIILLKGSNSVHMERLLPVLS